MRLHDVQTTAVFLGISRQSVDRLIADGALQATCIRSGRRKRIMRISDAALKKFLNLPPGQVLVIEPAVTIQSKKAEAVG